MISNIFVGNDLTVGESINVNNIVATSATISDTLTVSNISATVATMTNIDLTGGVITAQQFICSPVSQGAGVHVYGDSSYSAEIAFYEGTTGSGSKIWEIGGTTTSVVPASGNFFFIYSNLDSTNALTIETGSPMTINLLGNVYTPNTLTASDIVATSVQLNVTGSNPQGLSIIGTPTSGDATQIFF